MPCSCCEGLDNCAAVHMLRMDNDAGSSRDYLGRGDVARQHAVSQEGQLTELHVSLPPRGVGSETLRPCGTIGRDVWGRSQD